MQRNERLASNRMERWDILDQESPAVDHFQHVIRNTAVNNRRRERNS